MPQTDQFTTKLNLAGPIANYLKAVNTGAKEEFGASPQTMRLWSM